MAAADYDMCEQRVLNDEGGYTDDPKDPGGPTNFGITLADARRFWKPGASAADVRAMPVSVAKAIYRKRYWVANGLSCDDLPAGIDDSLFDYRVNSGVGRADKVLRRVCGLADGATNAMLLAVLAVRDPAAVIKAINAERLAFLRSLPTWPHFGAGWAHRVAGVNAFSLQLVAHARDAAHVQDTAPAPRPPIAPTAKGIVPPPAAAHKPIGLGLGAAAAATVASSSAWAAAHPLQLAALTAAGVAVFGLAAFLLERAHAARQQAPTPGLVPVPAAAAS